MLVLLSIYNIRPPHASFGPSGIETFALACAHYNFTTSICVCVCVCAHREEGLVEITHLPLLVENSPLCEDSDGKDQFQIWCLTLNEQKHEKMGKKDENRPKTGN